MELSRMKDEVKITSSEKQSLKNPMDDQLESDHLDCCQLLDKQENRQQCHREGLSDKADLLLYASVEDVLAESAERVPRVEFPKGPEGMEKGKNAACAVETQRQQYKITSPDSLKDQKRDYLNLAKKFCIPISGAIKHYDTLSKPDI